jgi:NAD(P)-dependent dehydrogenase (short-subunit alcohol dehydrogenase family)
VISTIGALMANCAVKVIITGVSPHGVGRAVCLAIATHEPRLLIITGRDENRTRVVQEELKTQWPSLNIRIVVIDLAQNESVQKAAEDINQICATEEGSIDVLINNAGIMCLPERTTTEDGTELHLQVNYVGHYILTRLLLSNLAKSAGGGRIVNVSSSAHAISPFRFSDPAFSHSEHVKEDEQPLEGACKEFETPWTLDYSPLIAYGQSKTALSLHAVALGQAVGKGTVAISVHPGGTLRQSRNSSMHNIPDEVQSSQRNCGVTCHPILYLKYCHRHH